MDYKTRKHFVWGMFVEVCTCMKTKDSSSSGSTHVYASACTWVTPLENEVIQLEYSSQTQEQRQLRVHSRTQCRSPYNSSSKMVNLKRLSQRIPQIYWIIPLSHIPQIIMFTNELAALLWTAKHELMPTAAKGKLRGRNITLHRPLL